MIDFQDVCFAYPGENNILSNLSFHINEGERVALIGANGAGKSTILKSTLGLLDVKGNIIIDGLKLEKKTVAQIRKSVGFVFQDSDNQMFMPRVIDDAIFGLVNYGMKQEEAVKKAKSILDQLGIGYLAEKHNYKISVGEKKMAAIATVLAMEPKAILLDEPTASLDPANRRKIIAALNNLDVTKVIATHDIDMVKATCDRVLLLNKGKIVADGPTENVLGDEALLEANNL